MCRYGRVKETLAVAPIEVVDDGDGATTVAS
jgi:hypothetical protein